MNQILTRIPEIENSRYALRWSACLPSFCELVSLQIIHQQINFSKVFLILLQRNFFLLPNKFPVIIQLRLDHQANTSLPGVEFRFRLDKYRSRADIIWNRRRKNSCDVSSLYLLLVSKLNVLRSCIWAKFFGRPFFIIFF